MKQSNWWRFCILILSSGLYLHWFIGIRMYDIGIYNEYTKPIAVLSLSCAIASVFLFFVSDRVFKTWLRFALVWFGVSLVWIASVPAYESGLFSMMNFTKGIVARLSSVLFVPVSLVFLLVASWKEKKSVG